MPVRALTLTAVAFVAWTAAELSGDGRVPFDDLRWRAGSPEILAGGRWVSLRSVQGVPVASLVADDVVEQGPAFLDRFPFDVERLLRRRGSRWGPLVVLGIEDRGKVHDIPRLSTRSRGRRLARRLEGRVEPVGDAASPARLPRIDPPPAWPHLGGLTGEEAGADLGVLAWHLAHRLASPRTDVPWREAIAAVRHDLGPGISRRDFALQVMSALALFEDGHVRLRRGESRIELSEHVLAARFVSVAGGVACLTPDERSFCAPAYPLLLAIDGQPLSSLLAALAPLAPRVSPDFHEAEVLDLLRHIDVARGLLGGTVGGGSILLLGNGKGGTLEQVAETTGACRDPPRPSVDVRILPSGEGYLGLRAGWPPGDAFVAELDGALRAVQSTSRLIIDVRGNRGGNREPVLHLLRRILPGGDSIVDLAVYRMDDEVRPPAAFGVLAGRGFHPPSAPWLGPEARIRAEILLAPVQARWALPPSGWSEWHIATLGPAPRERGYVGPILLMVDERSASATTLLVSALAPLDRVTTVGRAGGGGGGWPVDVRLPHSGLVVSLPSMFSVQPDGNTRHAIVPEVRHERTPDDLRQEMAGTEPVPSWAPILLDEGRSKR